jgi:hypothetical protein
MDSSKKAGFVKTMGKGRRRFAKGGMIRKIGNRHYFDAGGTVLGGPTQSLTNNTSVNPNTGITGTIGGLLGTNDQFSAGSANINPGTNTNQLNLSYDYAQNALNNANGIANTFTPQAGQAVNEQNAVAASEEGMLNGTGPNPALTQLATTTGQNVATTTAEMAGQRGAAANPALIAREAAQQGAATQQGAVGQAATLGAEQQIAAQQNLTSLAGQQAGEAGSAVTGQNTAQQNEQNILQGANTAANNAAVGMQENENSTNASTAQANQRNNQGILGGVASGISSLTGGLLKKGGVVGKDGDMKEEHLLLAEMNAHSLAHRQKMASGGITANPLLTPQPTSGAGNWASSYFQGSGGGQSAPASNPAPESASGTGFNDSSYQNAGSKAGSMLGKLFSSDSGDQSDEDAQEGYLDADAALGTGAEEALPAAADSAGLGSLAVLAAARGGKICPGPHASHMANYLAGGGPVEAMVSEGERYLSPGEVREVIHNGANPLKIGTKITAKNASQKASVKGDSLKNDKIPMTLEEGGVVLPRHVTKKMSPEKAELFVHRAMARKKARA